MDHTVNDLNPDGLVSVPSEPADPASRHDLLLNALLENTPDLIYVKDLDSRFILINRAHARHLGLSDPSEAVGKTDSDFFGAEHAAQALRDEQQVIRTGEPLLGLVEEEQLADGRHDWVFTSKLALRDSRGTIIGTFGISRDITARKLAEEKLNQANLQLAEAVNSERQALQQLQETQARLVQAEKLAGLGQLVAGVTHEINNPLAFVINNTAILQRDLAVIRRLLEMYRQGDADLRSLRPDLMKRITSHSERADLTYMLSNLDHILASSRKGLSRIEQIVSELRDFSCLDESDLRDVDVNRGIESTVNMIQGFAASRQVAIELKFQPLPLVACYPAKINQAVMNLLLNAVEACGTGGQVIIKTGTRGSGLERSVLIEVCDTGSGIDPAIRHRIFDPFFTTKPQGQGTGLGLSIAYGIVRDHQGAIEVTSIPDSGSQFTLALPAPVARDSSG